MFIDYLREHNVRVLSATENIDTCNENDDLIVGFKGLINDFYARDIGKKIRSGYRQKQKEGIVITPPFGYFKDKNSGQIVVVEEAAQTIRDIFSAYLSGVGLKTIARQLNEEDRKTPARMQFELMQKRMPDNYEKTVVKKYLWDATMVSRILRNESYVGTLICHKSERNKINKTFRFTEEPERYRHENYLPVIVAPGVWEQAQALLQMRKEQNTRAAPCKPIHRYTGLLRCADCDAPFVPVIRYWNDRKRIEYICKTYNRFGKAVCSSHRIHEETIDARLRSFVTALCDAMREEQCHVQKLQELNAFKAPALRAKKEELQRELVYLDQELDAILMAKVAVADL